MSRLVDSKMGHGPGTFILQDHRKRELIENKAFMQGARIVDKLNGTGQLGHWGHDHRSVGDIQGALLWHRDTRPIESWRYAWGVVTQGLQESQHETNLLPIWHSVYNPDQRFIKESSAVHPLWGLFPKDYIGIALTTTEEDKQTNLFFPTDKRLIASHRDDHAFSHLVADVKNGAMDVQAGLHTYAYVLHRKPENVVAMPVNRAWGYIWDGKQAGALSFENNGVFTTGHINDRHRLAQSSDGVSINSAHIHTGALYTDNGTNDGALDFDLINKHRTQGRFPFHNPVDLRFDGTIWRWSAESPFYSSGTFTTQGRPPRQWRVNDPHQPFLGSITPIAFTSIVMRPQATHRSKIDLRNTLDIDETVFEQYDKETPVVGRIEAFGRRTCSQFTEGTTTEGPGWTYTEKPSKGRYAGGTTIGGFVLLPPEVDVTDHVDDFAPSNRTISNTHFIAVPKARIGWGTIDVCTGGIKTGFFSEDNSGLLEFFAVVNSTATKRFIFGQSGVFQFNTNDFGGQLTHSNTADRLYTFPDKDGTVAMLSDVTANDEFIEHADTPASYSSQANKVVAVNSGETAVEFVDRLLLANNTAALPAYSYSGDPDTGMFHTASADTIGWSTNGVIRIQLDNNGFAFQDGTEAFPGLSYFQDRSMGLFRPTSTTMGFSTGGVERMRLSSAGLDVAEKAAIGSDASISVQRALYVKHTFTDNSNTAIDAHTIWNGSGAQSTMHALVCNIDYDGSGLVTAGGLISLNTPTRTGTAPTTHEAIRIANQGIAGSTDTRAIHILAQTTSTNPRGLVSEAANNFIAGLKVGGAESDPGAGFDLEVDGVSAFGDGTAALPSITFANASTLGFFKDGSALGLSFAGTQIYRFTAFGASIIQSIDLINLIQPLRTTTGDGFENRLIGGNALTTGAGGIITIRGGNAAGAVANAGGDVFLEPGNPVAGGQQGRVIIRNSTNTLTPDVLPRTDSEGSIGIDGTRWADLFVDDMRMTNVLDIDERSGDPGGSANRGKLYTKDVAGVTQLFYQRSDATVVQIT